MIANAKAHTIKILPHVIRDATEADDEKICGLIRRNSMPGALSLTMSHEPSFFASIEVEGFENRVLVYEEAEKLAGVTLLAKRLVSINGKPSVIGYLGHLRLDRSIRNTMALAHGIRFLKNLHESDSSPPRFYLCSILESNILSISKITRKRRGLPQSQKLGTLYTAAIPLIKRREIQSKNVQVTQGGTVGYGQVIHFLNSTGSKKQFFPVYSRSDLAEHSGLLRGLSLDDFHIAHRNGRIVGVAACWNQSPFRRIQVTGYSRGMHLAKAILAPFFSALKLPHLPNPGYPLKCVIAAGIAIEDDDPIVFQILLNSLLRSQYRSGNTFVLVGLMETDPLLAEVKKYWHFPTRSSILALSWDGLGDLSQLDNRAQYLELGSL